MISVIYALISVFYITNISHIRSWYQSVVNFISTLYIIDIRHTRHWYQSFNNWYQSYIQLIPVLYIIDNSPLYIDISPLCNWEIQQWYSLCVFPTGKINFDGWILVHPIFLKAHTIGAIHLFHRSTVTGCGWGSISLGNIRVSIYGSGKHILIIMRRRNLEWLVIMVISFAPINT